MPLKYILDRVASEAGYTNLADNPEQRSRLLKIINEAAEEVWEQTDLTACLREITVCVQADDIIALPSFVGEIRAIRERIFQRPWNLKDMRPRYHYAPWPQMWNHWRFEGYSPIMLAISNSAPFTYTIPVADSDLQITTLGETANETRVADIITMSTTSVPGVKNFQEVDSIVTNKPPTYDVAIYDANGNLISEIQNDSDAARYLIFNVSDYPSRGECPDGSRNMDVLYKMRLPKLINDTDCFPVDGFDHVIILKTKQLLVEQQEGKEKRALLIDAKVERTINRKMRSKEGVIQRRIKFAPNKFLGLFRPWTYRGSRRFSERYYGPYR